MNPSESIQANRGAFAQINGLRMYYESFGDGTPLILLHGGLSTGQMWAPIVPVLANSIG